MMKSTYTILKTLNTVLENKETYSAEAYRDKLLELKDEIDQLLLTEQHKNTTEKEQELIVQQYQLLMTKI